MEKTIFFVLMISSTSSVIFDCDFDSKAYGSIGVSYVCTAAVSISGDATTLTGVRGTHMGAKKDEDVRVLYATGQQAISQFPNDLEKFFPNLAIILMWRGNLTSITADVLKPFPNLLEISLHTNQFTTLDGNLFQNTKKLRYINFGDNQLIKVGPGLLANLVDLRFAYFHSNPCINIEATSPEQIPALINALETFCLHFLVIKNFCSTSDSTVLSTEVPSSDEEPYTTTHSTIISSSTKTGLNQCKIPTKRERRNDSKK